MATKQSTVDRVAHRRAATYPPDAQGTTPVVSVDFNQSILPDWLRSTPPTIEIQCCSVHKLCNLIQADGFEKLHYLSN